MNSLRGSPHFHVLEWVIRDSGTLRDFFSHVRQRWYLYLPLMGVWTLAYLRLFFLPVPYTPVLFNWTPSLPYRVAVLHPLTVPPAKGDYILYRFAGPAQAQYPGLHGQPFFKRISGLPGDEITVIGRRVYINNELVGEAKSRTFDGRPLLTVQPTVIPEGHYFVSGSSPDSFDSRYAASGLVRADQIIGRVEPRF